MDAAAIEGQIKRDVDEIYDKLAKALKERDANDARAYPAALVGAYKTMVELRLRMHGITLGLDETDDGYSVTLDFNQNPNVFLSESEDGDADVY